MPYPGPWQDPLVFREEIRPGTSGQAAGSDGEILPHPAVETSGHRPTGFSFSHPAGDLVSGFTGATTVAYAGSQSACALGHAFQGTADEGNMWDLDLEVCKLGTEGQTTAGGESVARVTHTAQYELIEITDPDRDQLTDSWTASALSYRFAFSIGHAAGWASPYTHAPDGADWPAGVIDVEIEEPTVTLERVWVPGWQGLEDDVNRDLFDANIKEPGDAGAHWLDLSTVPDWASLAEMHSYPEVPHGYALTDGTNVYDLTSGGVAWLQESWENGLAGSPVDVNDPEQPRIGIAWNGTTPTPDAVADADTPFAEAMVGVTDLTVVVRLQYHGSRWRYIYAEPVTAPYRRIGRRGGDGLAGGARRVGGRTKTVQGSNRRGASAIV